MNIPFADAFLNTITMYRLVMYDLMVAIAAAFVLAFFHVFSFTPWALLFSFALITAVCWVSNEALAKLFRVTANSESVYITAFILVLIITPVEWNNWNGALLTALAGLLAMASKYILAIRGKHIFNPAAFAVAVTGLWFGFYASWWVGGTLPLLAVVLVGGLLVVRKVQRFEQFFVFSAVALAGVVFVFLPQNPLLSIWQTILHSSLLFFATIMLTEPLTSPHTRGRRILYAAIVGFFFIPGVHFGSFYYSPEVALLVGNIFAFIASPMSRRVLAFKEVRQIADNIYDFTFVPNRPLAFAPGQYLEWTAGGASSDLRGNRRYFTIASSPTEREIHLGIKTYERSSTFKKALLTMQPGETLMVGQLSGDFTLPRDRTKKLALIAGGIGITPYRSMIQYLVDRNDRRDVVLLYSTRSPAEIAYKEVFDEAAAAIGLKAVYTQNLDKNAMMRAVPDYKERVFYLSGPRSMVVAFEKTLKELGVPRRNIKIDFFPGFA